MSNSLPNYTLLGAFVPPGAFSLAWRRFGAKGGFGEAEESLVVSLCSHFGAIWCFSEVLEQRIKALSFHTLLQGAISPVQILII